MAKAAPPYLLDVQGMKAWAGATGNISAVILNAIEANSVHIYNRVWDTFESAYPDEAATIPKHEFARQRCNEEHRLAAAALAERLNAMFPRKGPHDDAIEWLTVGIAVCGPYTIVTDRRRKLKYAGIDGVAVVTFDELLDLL